MQQSNDRADGKRQLEAKRHVNQNPTNADAQGHKRTFRQLTADERPYSLFALNFETGVWHRLLDLPIDDFARVDRAANSHESFSASLRLLYVPITTFDPLEAV